MNRITTVAIAAFMFIVASPSIAAADCASTCGDVCFAPEASAFFRAEVIDARDGFATRVRLVESFGGSTEVPAAVGDELDEVYSQTIVAVGDQLFVTLSNFDDGSGVYPYNVAWRIEANEVVCETTDRRIPLDQYAAMATSTECLEISDQLSISNSCDDTPGAGCAASGGTSLLGVLAALGLVLAGRGRRVKP
ncbi:MAG: hypothetical protein H6Q90_4725 [Deltaproteobacteria bacterium]|nr:hypothetical protein [Deltaproteobacteria bacterium]